MTIGAKIKEQLELKNMSTQDLADKTGLDIRYIEFVCEDLLYPHNRIKILEDALKCSNLESPEGFTEEPLEKSDKLILAEYTIDDGKINRGYFRFDEYGLYTVQPSMNKEEMNKKYYPENCKIIRWKEVG